jgi:hypothetical protein
MTASSILRNASCQPRRLRPEASLRHVSIQQSRIHQRLQQGRDHHFVIRIQCVHDLCHTQAGAQHALRVVGQIERARRFEGCAQPFACRDPG